MNVTSTAPIDSLLATTRLNTSVLRTAQGTGDMGSSAGLQTANKAVFVAALASSEAKDQSAKRQTLDIRV